MSQSSVDQLLGRLVLIQGSYANSRGSSASLISDIASVLSEASSLLENVPVMASGTLPSATEVISPVEVGQILSMIGDLNALVLTRRF